MKIPRRSLFALPLLAVGQKRVTADSLEAFSVPVNKRGDWLLVRLKASNGATGIGDASHGGLAGIATDRKLPVMREMFALLRGQPVTDIARLHRAVRPLIQQHGNLGAVVWGGLEQALWDLVGQSAGMPVHAFFGGKLRDSLRQYANINRSAEPRTPDGFAAMARSAVAAGFGAVKLAPFDGMPKEPAAAARHTDTGVACVEAVRKAIGAERDLLVDAHGFFDRAGSLQLAKRLEPQNLYWLEETCPASDLASLGAVNAAVTMTTAGGEEAYGVEGFRKLIEAKAFDILMPDIKYCGGLLECFRISAAAEAAGLRIAPHGPASPVGNIAAAHVCAAIPNFDILEYSHGEVPWRAEVIEPAETNTAGALKVPDSPGLGARLNDALLRSRGRKVA